MTCIVDSTLTMLDEKAITCQQVLLFIRYMKCIGINNFEISNKVYKMIKNKNFHNVCFYVTTRINASLGPKSFLTRVNSNGTDKSKQIESIEVKRVQDIVNLKKRQACDYIRITGLSNLLNTSYIEQMGRLRGTLGKARINFCPSDQMHCATGLALTWLLCGFGEEVTTSFAGAGERAATEEVILALYVNNQYEQSNELNYLEKLRCLYEEMTADRLSFMKPVVGETIFCVESGIHVDGITKNPKNYELYSPELVGKKTCIIIGKDSGRKSIQLKLQKLGINEHRVNLNLLLSQVRTTSVSLGRNITDDEFIQLANEVRLE